MTVSPQPLPPELDAIGRPHWQIQADRIRNALNVLPDKPSETVESTLSTLWHLAAGVPLSCEAAAERPLPPLDAAGLERLDTLVRERVAGRPLAHMTGRQRFMSLEMIAGPGALIPRRESELLAHTALRLMSEMPVRHFNPIAIDVCTGSGNIALAIAHALPSCRVHGSDLSAEAVELARQNASELGLASRVTLHVGDLFEPLIAVGLAGQAILVTCNPPYVSSARVPNMAPEIASHEPPLAFDGGPFGISILRRMIREAPLLLVAGGWLVLEVGLGQGQSVLHSLRASSQYADVAGVEDDEGNVRVVFGRRIDRT